MITNIVSVEYIAVKFYVVGDYLLYVQFEISTCDSCSSKRSQKNFWERSLPQVFATELKIKIESQCLEPM